VFINYNNKEQEYMLGGKKYRNKDRVSAMLFICEGVESSPLVVFFFNTEVAKKKVIL